MARRTRGDGSVYQDKAGQWWAKIPIGGGRTRRARCAHRAEATATLRRLIQERDAGLDLRASQQTVASWLQSWLDAKAETVSPGTLRFYQRHCGYMLPYIGHIRLEALEPGAVRSMLTALLRDGLAPQSVSHVRSVLNNALGMAMKESAIVRNVAALVDSPRVVEYEAHLLSEEEIGKLLAACEHERLGLVVIFALTLGLRRGELLGLRWADVHYEQGTLTIAQSKTKAGRRTLPLTTDLIIRLRAHWAIQQEERRRVPNWKEHGLIFASEVGTPILPRNLNRIFKRLLRDAGLSSDIRLHDLRHTAITDWIADGGADPKTAQALAGHSDPQTTMRIYAKARVGKLRGVIEEAEQKRNRRKLGS